LASTALLSSLASFEAAFAQEVTQLPTLQVHDELATSVQRANQLRHNSPNAKIVIEAEQLNQFNDQSIGDAIRRLPGVTFSSPNRSRSIKLRGLGKEYTTVLLDGRPIIDGDSSRAMEVDRIPTIFVERLESPAARSPPTRIRVPAAPSTSSPSAISVQPAARSQSAAAMSKFWHRRRCVGLDRRTGRAGALLHRSRLSAPPA
jgi:hypothetical protein